MPLNSDPTGGLHVAKHSKERSKRSGAVPLCQRQIHGSQGPVVDAVCLDDGHRRILAPGCSCGPNPQYRQRISQLLWLEGSDGNFDQRPLRPPIPAAFVLQLPPADDDLGRDAQTLFCLSATEVRSADAPRSARRQRIHHGKLNRKPIRHERDSICDRKTPGSETDSL